MGDSWVLYILQCSDGTLYTGITNDLERRLSRHGEGRASRYTRSRLPVQLVYRESVKGRSQALRRECSIKAMSRRQKKSLISLSG
ncbi:MAG TPA: GIY-YIG nuclease family protein [Nitrospiria bacterium]